MHFWYLQFLHFVLVTASIEHESVFLTQDLYSFPFLIVRWKKALKFYVKYEQWLLRYLTLLFEVVLRYRFSSFESLVHFGLVPFT